MLNRDAKGFSLIELMIVVAILGILAAVAIPSYSHFVRASKTSDGLEKVKAIADGAILYFNTEHHINNNGLQKSKNVYPHCGGSTPGVCNTSSITLDGVTNKAPLTVDDISIPVPPLGAKNQLKKSEYIKEPWIDLGFQVGGPTYFNYGYRAWVSHNVVADGTSQTITDGSSFAAAALGSLRTEGDSKVWIEGKPDGTVTPLFRNE